MLLYRGIVVGSSELGTLLKDDKIKQARDVFAGTTQRYQALYPEEDRKWFDAKSREGWPTNLSNKQEIKE